MGRVLVVMDDGGLYLPEPVRVLPHHIQRVTEEAGLLVAPKGGYEVGGGLDDEA